MSLPVKWTKDAKEDYSEILIWLENQYGIESALAFLESTEKLIEQISVFPESCKASPKFKNIRKGTIKKRTSLIYRLSSNKIEILHLWDNRANPYRHSDLF